MCLTCAQTPYRLCTHKRNRTLTHTVSRCLMCDSATRHKQHRNRVCVRAQPLRFHALPPPPRPANPRCHCVAQGTNSARLRAERHSVTSQCPPSPKSGQTHAPQESVHVYLTRTDTAQAAHAHAQPHAVEASVFPSTTLSPSAPNVSIVYIGEFLGDCARFLFAINPETIS